MLHLILSIFIATPMAQAAPMPLTYSPKCTFEAVAHRMGYPVDPSKPFPNVFVASEIPLEQFQDAVEEQWKMRPSAVLNVYVVELNEIYLLDEESYYLKVKRYIDDSLAHELAHYVQVVYRGADLNSDHDFYEQEAVHVQTWFRETFMKTGAPPCSEPSGALIASAL